MWQSLLGIVTMDCGPGLLLWIVAWVDVALEPGNAEAGAYFTCALGMYGQRVQLVGTADVEKSGRKNERPVEPCQFCAGEGNGQALYAHRASGFERLGHRGQWRGLPSGLVPKGA